MKGKGTKRNIQPPPQIIDETLFTSDSFKLSRLSNEKFIQLCEHLNSLPDFWSKIALIHSLSREIDGLLCPVQREINGKIFEFGLKITNVHDAEIVANLYIDILLPDWVEPQKQDVEGRLRQCKTKFEKIGLVQAEIQRVEQRMIEYAKGSKDYYEGYQSEKLKKTRFSYVASSFWIDTLPNDNLNKEILIMTCMGAADRKLEVYLNKLLILIQSDERLPFEFTFESEYINILREENQPFSDSSVSDIQKPLSMTEVALIFAYGGNHITEQNAKDIAVNYGWTSKNSGKKLLQKFSYYVNRTNRIGFEKEGKNNSVKPTANKLALIRRIIPHLETDAQKLSAKADADALAAKLN